LEYHLCQNSRSNKQNTKGSNGLVSDKTKYYIRRVIATLLIASPCYLWSQTIVLLGFIGLAYISPDALVAVDESIGVSFFILLVWVTMFTLGWIGSKYLIVRPPEIIMQDHYDKKHHLRINNKTPKESSEQ
jgi:hypothetical protein